MRITQERAATHPGARRSHNEDAVLDLPTVPLFAVADGMGGPQNGADAAGIALNIVRQYAEPLVQANRRVLKQRSTANRLALSNLLDDLFNSASRAITEEKGARQAANMGSTLVLATLVRNFAYIAHVGDSRAYLVRQGRLVRLTEDHSLAEYRYRRGRITREEYEESPERRLLYQILGAGVEVEVDVAEVRLVDGDQLLLCSDGLTRALDEGDIAGLVDHDPDASTQRLIRAANEAGADDNVSVILVELEAETDDEPIEALTDTLGKVFLFDGLSQPELLVIAPYLEEQVYEKGTTIFSEGDPGDAFYVVSSGKVRVSRRNTTLVDIKQGGHFGELALARPAERSATCKAAARTRVFQLSRERFQELVRHKPDLGAKLTLALLDAVGVRLRDLTERLSAVERAVHGDFG